MLRYVTAIGLALDILANAITGGRAYQTISCRIGLSIQRGEWASRVPWPAAWRRHFLGSVYTRVV